ncbi:beta-lactamase family protein [Pyxidicoccus sp. MSG2]|uniref:beta-lactamase family protein n=1 Tax=Pyxidicoccus sp. MSG2 TaxID=2996790 RepID=UPI00227044F2|nr:beta-lactamase family protein [Pyxidicoccus sp. MSG2]MCY1023021.1 beta-lactamase family protein [Pyxidicoccus sp. MSG2]
MNWLKTLCVGVVVAWVCVGPAAEAASQRQELDRLITKYQQMNQFNGSVLVANEKGVILEKGYGFANFEWQVANTPDTKFRIGSVTKQFTSMVIMQLVAEGKLQVEDPVTKYLPDYRKDTGDRITIAHLLNHTSGLPNYTNPTFFKTASRDPYTVADFVKKFCSGDLEFEPGTKFNYSNSGYFLLGAVIEKVTGQTYAQTLQQRIFDPVGMKNTGYDVSATVLPKRASGYEAQPGGYVNAPYLDMGLPYAAGSMYSTVQDLYRWDRALYEDKLLPAPLKQRMFTTALDDYAFGWHVGPIKLHDGKTEVATISHSGGINGFSALFVRAPERKEVVVLLDNTARGSKLMAMATGALSILHGIPPKQPQASIGEVVMATLEKSSAAEAIARYRTLKTTKATEYDFAERELNNVGYRLLGSGRVAEAIEIFKLNVEMFPGEGNVYDSLGEAYLAGGNKEQALVNYRRAVELNPKNTSAAETVKRLEQPAATR